MKKFEDMIKGSHLAAENLKALAHETRLLTLCFLSDGEKTVQELEKLLRTSQSNVSQHLAKRRSKGIVEKRKEANLVYYKVAEKKTIDLIHQLQSMYC